MIKYPNVNVIKGSGNLFWNKGMRLAWETALNCRNDYDFYLWLNDDSFIYKDAILHLFDCFDDYKKIKEKDSLIVGACKEKGLSNIFSYGLRMNERIIVPNGKTQVGNIMNGNLVLVPKIIFKKIGILSNKYTHAMGDHDYGLRAIEEGFELVSTKKFVAVCESNKNLPPWCDPKISVTERWKSLNSPLGLNLKEYKFFRKRFWRKSYFIDISKIYFRFLFPTLYIKIKN